jgi:hypothetical protein
MNIRRSIKEGTFTKHPISSIKDVLIIGIVKHFLKHSQNSPLNDKTLPLNEIDKTSATEELFGAELKLITQLN